MPQRIPKYGATTEHVDHLSQLIAAIRPSWDYYVVRQVVADIARRTTLEDLVIGCTRAASNLDFRAPRSMAWSGPAWAGLATRPPDTRSYERCGVCMRLEPDCAAVRPGADDDHLFEPLTDVRLVRR